MAPQKVWATQKLFRFVWRPWLWAPWQNLLSNLCKKWWHISKKIINAWSSYFRLLFSWKWRKTTTWLSHLKAPEHIFPGKVQKDVEMLPEALTEHYERGNADLSTPVRACHAVTACKQHQVVCWETDYLRTCSFVFKVVICWNIESCVWKEEAPAQASWTAPWLNVSHTWMLQTGKGW